MDTDTSAETIWNYMHMNMPLSKADAIFVLCSHDTRVADRAAELFHQGYAKWVIVSGGVGKLTKDMFDKSEAEVFQDALVAQGVPENCIILETASRNTGENIQFVYRLLEEQRRHFDSFILVQKPYMERRTYATFKKQWPNPATEFSVTSPRMTYADYVSTGPIDKDTIINAMVGDLQRIREYPARGFQIPQDIPKEVEDSFNVLVHAGYDKHLIDAE